MSDVGRARGVLREGSENPERVTWVELFFDLVFAFAVTQVTELLTVSPDVLDVIKTVIVCLAIWWVWVYTTWAMNWLDPETRPVLWLLMLLTALGLLLSETVPEAFESKALLFVGAYLAYGFVRTISVIVGTRRDLPVVADGQWRILWWSAGAAVLWVTGALVESDWLQVLLWAGALTVEYGGPAVRFWLPGRGRSSWEAWRVRGGHFAERSALFIIIVLGESILVVGRALSEHGLTEENIAASLSAFIDAVVLWFLYFAHGQERGHRFISAQGATGPVARASYTYLHVILVIGIVLTTHAVDLVIHDPHEEASPLEVGLLMLAPALYLVGLVSFKRTTGVLVRWIPSHAVGAAVLVGLFLVLVRFYPGAPVLAVTWLSTAVLVAVLIGDEVLWVRRRGSSLKPTGSTDAPG
ncbi:low temperature requirement protein A [Curtobacterium flaccumfaciens pv. flaccumfaciens]|uniref:low temperature requirement protein A n=1 Tax=Curtobacterium flaccumfaciens TaxID=2035 RepID=UPI001BCFC5FD|nr:low temperature requirement protein A [Curtobacterium flaccumfaciens]QVG65564.1 low temperature requirement protein A [Curtobacterium flaccumfaciens pv. flaccumfaciens]